MNVEDNNSHPDTNINMNTNSDEQAVITLPNLIEL